MSGRIKLSRTDVFLLVLTALFLLTAGTVYLLTPHTVREDYTVEALTPAEEQAAEVESIPAANKRITELRRKISALGTPNLGAIDEYARVNERYTYLTGQRDDVLHARGELEHIIQSITGEMTEIFVREFEKINEYFGKTFTEMFGGGKATLVL